NGGANLTLENAYVQYRFRSDWSVRAGQWKDNVFHEENVRSSHQLAVDRSLVNELLGGGNTDYVQGVAMVYDKGGALRGEVSFHDGVSSGNTDFVDRSTNFGFSGRAEYAIMGGYSGYSDFTAAHIGGRESEDMLIVGAGFDWTQ